MKNRKNSKSSEKPKSKNYLGYIFLFSMMGIVGYGLVDKLIEHIKIKSNEGLSKGVVINTKKTGSKGSVYCTYRFYYNNMLFTGSDYKGGVKVGDSLMITFSKKDPTINKFD
jgi:hypothetical protein